MDFLGMGPMEMLLIAFIALLVLGPNRVVEMARTLGKAVKEIRKVTAEVPKVLNELEDATKPKASPTDAGRSKTTPSTKAEVDKPGTDKGVWRS